MEEASSMQSLALQMGRSGEAELKGIRVRAIWKKQKGNGTVGRNIKGDGSPVKFTDHNK